MENQTDIDSVAKLGSSILGKAGTRRCQAFLLDWGVPEKSRSRTFGNSGPDSLDQLPIFAAVQRKKRGRERAGVHSRISTGTCTLEQGPQGGAKDEQELSTGRERNCDFQGRDLVYELLEILELQRVMQ